MKSPFARVLKIASRRYRAVLGLGITSLIIALLWSANISVMYPIVEVVFDNKTLTQYTAEKLAETNEEIRAIDRKLDADLSGHVRRASDRSPEFLRSSRPASRPCTGSAFCCRKRL
ncbi:MAG: hypothetical protein AAFU85_26385, partial [Planctomycetota bacterium]